MYRCKFFYASDKTPRKSENTVIAAWEITADRLYSFDMSEDALLMKNMYCLIRSTEGGGVIKTSGGELELAAGELIILRREDILSYRSADCIWSYYWVDFLPNGIENLCIGQKISVGYSQRERELFGELLSAGTKHPYEARYINSIFSHYFYFLLIGDRASSGEQRSPRFSEIASYVEQKLYGTITVAETAKFFGVSTRRINQIFHQNTGMSPKQYITKMKLEKADELLIGTSATLSEIAAMLGYDSPYHFSGAFKKAKGKAPRQYRKENMK